MQFDQVMCSHDTPYMVGGVWYDITRWETDTLFYVHHRKDNVEILYGAVDCVFLDWRPGAFYSFRMKPKTVVYAQVAWGSDSCIYGPFENIGDVFKDGYIRNDSRMITFAHVFEDTPFEVVVEILSESGQHNVNP